MHIASTIKRIGIAILAVAIVAAAYFALTAPKASALTPLSNIQPGDLIRGETYSAVYYYGVDGFRYVFPNSKTYNTWYDNFDNVKFLSDEDLGKVQIGGNATYKPGVKMVKIQSDPKTYAVAKGGTLRHVTSESVAVSLYGSNWNQMIDDVPDGFFSNYTISSDAIEDSAEYDPSGEQAQASTIGINKGLEAPAEIGITDSGYSPIDVTVEAGKTVKFTNNGSSKHSVTGEDLSWGSGTLNPGDTFRKTFDEAGTYPFFDSYDTSNSGAVYVQ